MGVDYYVNFLHKSHKSSPISMHNQFLNTDIPQYKETNVIPKYRLFSLLVRSRVVLRISLRNTTTIYVPDNN